MHPLLARALHEDGDGSRPQQLFDDVSFCDSKASMAIQLADLAGWILRRHARGALVPGADEARESFDLLRDLVREEAGRTIEFFHVGPLRPDQVAMYAGLRGEQPAWWLGRAR
jgi:hypothetical protein